ncbi:MAG: hypothetical protein ONB11_03750 [candidate division KSB1 bacterium]|nr:hypothetical protein [candidate division KSB1 bacterium]
MGIEIRVVADTGPLIHLSEIGCINLLNNFHMIYVPESVHGEYFKHKKANGPDFFELKNVTITKVQPEEVSAFINSHGLSDLHSGERDCLYLCQRLSVDKIFTDDLAVREAAKKLGITPVGSLGIIARLFKERYISLDQAKKLLLSLYQTSSVFVTKTLVDMVIEELRKLK